MIRYAGLEKQSVSDGPGIRLVVFLQGCEMQCPDCHNPQLQIAEGGLEIEEEELAALLVHHLTPLHKGITLSGGDPLFQAESLNRLLKILKKQQPALNIWLYTGYLFEEVQELPALQWIDVLVDGPFLKTERDLDLAFRGSHNQRLIDVPKSLQTGQTERLNI